MNAKYKFTAVMYNIMINCLK